MWRWKIEEVCLKFLNILEQWKLGPLVQGPTKVHTEVSFEFFSFSFFFVLLNAFLYVTCAFVAKLVLHYYRLKMVGGILYCFALVEWGVSSVYATIKRCICMQKMSGPHYPIVCYPFLARIILLGNILIPF